MMRLPKPAETNVTHDRRHIGSVYTAEQMRKYAAKAVAAEREACKQIIRETPFSNWFQADLIEAIDKRGQALAQPKQDGDCKKCKDGCPACDARKIPNDLL